MVCCCSLHLVLGCRPSQAVKPLLSAVAALHHSPSILNPPPPEGPTGHPHWSPAPTAHSSTWLAGQPFSRRDTRLVHASAMRAVRSLESLVYTLQRGACAYHGNMLPAAAAGLAAPANSPPQEHCSTVCAAASHHQRWSSSWRYAPRCGSGLFIASWYVSEPPSAACCLGCGSAPTRTSHLFAAHALHYLLAGSSTAQPQRSTEQHQTKHLVKTRLTPVAGSTSRAYSCSQGANLS